MVVKPIQNLRGNQYRSLSVTIQVELYDKVKIFKKSGKSVKGEIVFISEKEITLTEPYKPLIKVRLKDIDAIARWTPTEDYW